MERLTQFVSSRGLLKRTNFHNENPISSSDFLDNSYLNKIILVNDSIYICTDSIVNFCNNYLPNIYAEFTLISGDSDRPVDIDLISNELVKGLLNNHLLTKWFAQNLVCKHPKLQPIPIGMDYHTMWERPGTWGLIRQSPIAQEHALINTFANAPDFGKRLFAGYCNWHFAIDRGDRQACLKQIDKRICLIESNHLPRISSWQRQAECMFVISPEGAGIDCHRTWEALLLGCVPVIKRNGLSDLFNKLPVIILNDWSEFNQTNILQYVVRLQQEKFDFNSLFAAYWQARFLGNEDFNLPKMTMAEFKNFVCGNSF